MGQISQPHQSQSENAWSGHERIYKLKYSQPFQAKSLYITVPFPSFINF